MRLSHRWSRAIALAAVLVAIGIAVPRFLTHTPYPRFGVRFDWDAPGHRPVVSAVVGPPGQGLLQKGDIVLEVEGRPFTPEHMMAEMKQGRWRGPISLEIERRGQRLSIMMPPLRLGAWQRVRTLTFPLVAVIAAPLVAFLLVWRRPDLNTAWVFLWFAILQAAGTIWSLFRYPQGDPSPALGEYLTVYHAFVLWFPAAFLHFMTVFPRPRWNPRRFTRSVWFWIVVAAYVAPVVLIVLSRVLHRGVDSLYLGFQTVVIPLGALSLIERYARRPKDVARPQARERVIAVVVAVTLLLATAIDLVPEDPRMVAFFSVPWARMLYTVVFFTWLGSPLLIAYLIANDPVFDPRRIVVRSLPYAVLSGVLASLYLGVVLVGERLFQAATGEEAMAFNVVAALVVAYAFAPFRERLQRALNRLYGRDPEALRRALDQTGHELLSALDRDEVRAAVEAGLQRGLRRTVAIEWPAIGLPQLTDEVRAEERGAVENLLVQAGIRLENLELQAQRAAAETAAIQAELRALQAQVQPHFLFNALNALAYLIETEPKAAQRFTERLADMLRYTVEAGERPAALLSDEIGFVEDYLGVARERYENPLTFEYVGPPDLLSTAVPPLMLQPLVENSLKHGCVPGDEALHMTLEARAESGWLTLVFRDDGLPSANGHGLGTGLQNLAQRVRRFGGAGAALTSERRDRGFAVTLTWRAKGRAVA